MAYVLGIDEAGLSPVVGPLVVSGALFKTSAADEGANFWRMLEGCICRRVKDAAGRLVVTDSKAVHKKGDLTRLEEAVFSFLYSRGDRRIKNLAQLLKRINASVEHEDYPWYAPDSLELPTKVWDNTARRQGRNLREAMRGEEMAFVAAYSEPVLASRFNGDIARTRNKSTLLWERVSRIIYQAMKVCGGENLTVCVDKLGGRERYDDLLEDVLGDAQPERAKMGRDVSVYEYSHGGGRVRVLFIKSGEEKALPVALASMFSKYVRELFLIQLNAWFCERLPGLKPTAGYHKDGWRFVNETKSYREENGIPKKLLVRSR